MHSSQLGSESVPASVLSVDVGMYKDVAKVSISSYCRELSLTTD